MIILGLGVYKMRPTTFHIKGFVIKASLEVVPPFGSIFIGNANYREKGNPQCFESLFIVVYNIEIQPEATHRYKLIALGYVKFIATKRNIKTSLIIIGRKMNKMEE